MKGEVMNHYQQKRSSVLIGMMVVTLICFGANFSIAQEQEEANILASAHPGL